MELVISIFACVLISIFIGIQWVNGIDYMHNNYPDYKGEDLFDEELEPNEALKEAAKKHKQSKNE
jgi:hypothetical protein